MAIQTINFSDLPDKYRISYQPNTYNRPLPVAAVEKQSIDWIYSMRHGRQVEPSAIEIAILKNAYLIVKDGMDGLVCTNSGLVLRESRLFATIADKKIEEYILTSIGQKPDAIEFNEALVGFDGAWTNYYHWIVFGLCRSRIALNYANIRCPVLIPSYRDRQRQQRKGQTPLKKLAYREDVWEESLSFFNLKKQTQELPDGCYKIRNLLYCWPDKKYPTAITEHPSFYEGIHQSNGPNPLQSHNKLPEGTIERKRWPLKIYILRKSEPRIPAEITSWLSAWLEDQGVEIIQLEKFNFFEQMQIFRHCTHVIAPHGAGLTNLLLTGSHKISILEFNTTFEGESKLRPWFYLLAANMGHSYWFINLDEKLSQFELKKGIQRFIESRIEGEGYDSLALPWSRH